MPKEISMEDRKKITIKLYNIKEIKAIGVDDIEFASHVLQRVRPGMKIGHLTLTGRIGRKYTTQKDKNHPIKELPQNRKFEAECDCGQDLCEKIFWIDIWYFDPDKIKMGHGYMQSFNRKQPIACGQYQSAPTPQGTQLIKELIKGRYVGNKKTILLGGLRRGSRSGPGNTTVKALCGCGVVYWPRIRSVTGTLGCIQCCQRDGLSAIDHVKKNTIIDENGCHTLTNIATKYPCVLIHGTKTQLSRHFLEEKLGRPIKDGMLACHECGNNRCVNPDHIYEGTQVSNAKDTIVHGTYWRSVTPEKVLFILKLGQCDISDAIISEIVGVNKSHVGKIRNQNSWKWLTDDESFDIKNYKHYPVDLSETKKIIAMAKGGQITDKYKKILNVAEKFVQLKKEYEATIELAKELCRSK